MNEQALHLLTVLGDIDASYVDVAAPVRPAKRIAAAVSIAASVVLAVGIGMWQSNLFAPPISSSDSLPTATTQRVTTTTAPFEDTDDSKIIFTNPAACYSEGPDIGEAFVEFTLLEFLDYEEGENPTVPASITLHDENGPVLHSEKVYAELDRLKSLGYELYVLEEVGTDYWGETRHVTHIVSYMTREQVLNFPVGDEFAYSVSYNFYSVPIEEYTLY